MTYSTGTQATSCILMYNNINIPKRYKQQAQSLVSRLGFLSFVATVLRVHILLHGLPQA